MSRNSANANVQLNVSLGNMWPFSTRCSAIAERPRCRVRYSLRQKQNIRTGRQWFTDII